jgi:dTDP-4-amino-4,6-dideoxygalactose transaminase
MESKNMNTPINVVKPMIDEHEIENIIEVLKSGMIAEGPQAKLLEKEFAEYTGVKHAIFVNNGTTALHLAMEALDLPPGSEIITPGFTFIASSNSISFIGAIPIFGEINNKTWNLDPDSIEKLITPNTKAIMPVHIFGLPANMKEINELAQKHDLFVIEDSAQGHGGKINGKHVGNFGDIACFSFYATKNMITGEGGMVVTNNDDLADKARSIKNHGRAANVAGGYAHYRIGYNFRAPDYSAAIGRAQLKKLPAFLSARKRNAEFYKKELVNLPIEWQEIPSGHEHGNYIFALRLMTDKIKVHEVVSKLKEKHIVSRPIYDVPVYKQPAYLNIKNWRWFKAGINYPEYQKVSLPITETIATSHLEIPVHPGLTEEETHYVAQNVKEILKNL